MTAMSTRTEAQAAAPEGTARKLTYVKAFNEGLAQAMREDENVFVAA